MTVIWYRSYVGENAQEELVCKASIEDVLRDFDTAVAQQQIDGRPLLGMWLINYGTKNGSTVVDTWGTYPATIEKWPRYKRPSKD